MDRRRLKSQARNFQRRFHKPGDMYYTMKKLGMSDAEIEARMKESQREMLGNDADYFEAAGIDDIGCK